MDFDINSEKIQVEKDGKIIDCDVLFTFDCEANGRSYVGYTDHSFTNGRKNIIVSSFDPEDPEAGFSDVTGQEELMMVRDVLEQIDREASQEAE